MTCSDIHGNHAIWCSCWCVGKVLRGCICSFAYSRKVLKVFNLCATYIEGNSLRVCHLNCKRCCARGSLYLIAVVWIGSWPACKVCKRDKVTDYSAMIRGCVYSYYLTTLGACTDRSIIKFWGGWKSCFAGPKDKHLVEPLSHSDRTIYCFSPSFVPALKKCRVF